MSGHPTDRVGGISVQKAYNHLRHSVREMSCLFNMGKLMPFVFGDIKISFLVTQGLNG